jgi:protein-arginine kinase activator protein McsA
MTPEEFYHIDKLGNKNETLLEMRIRSLGWVLDCFRNGKIRKQTITGLIDREKLDEVLDYLLEEERYEDCAIVRDILEEVYNGETQKQIK